MVWALWCFGKVKETCSSTLGEKKRQLPGEAEEENRSPQEEKIISLGDRGQQNEFEDSWCVHITQIPRVPASFIKPYCPERKEPRLADAQRYLKDSTTPLRP